jgi:translation initiation factor 3 subunit I
MSERTTGSERSGDKSSDEGTTESEARPREETKAPASAQPTRLLKGHSRPVTVLCFSREGDLLFSAAKDTRPCLWRTESGERVGTYNGHQGAVWALDVDERTTRLITGSADTTARIWDTETGVEVMQLKHHGSVRGVAFAQGTRMALTVQDTTFGASPAAFCWNLDDEPAAAVDEAHEAKRSDDGEPHPSVY